MSPRHATATDPNQPSVRPGRTPVAAPAAAPLALLVALLLLALGALGIRDALVAAGVLDGELFTVTIATAVDGFGAQTWMVPVGIALAVVGLLLLVVALKPRRRTELAVSSTVGVWIRPADVARIATYAAEDAPGVSGARSTATRRRVVVTVESLGADQDTLRADATAEVNARLAPLDPAPKVTVHVRSNGA